MHWVILWPFFFPFLKIPFVLAELTLPHNYHQLRWIESLKLLFFFAPFFFLLSPGNLVINQEGACVKVLRFCSLHRNSAVK